MIEPKENEGCSKFFLRVLLVNTTRKRYNKILLLQKFYIFLTNSKF